MFFRRASVRYGRTPEPETPFQKAAQVWDERIGSARVQARNWRLIAFANLFLAAGLAGGLVWQAARGTVTPWVVEIDKLGQVHAISPAVADYRPTDPQIAWHLARFIENVRSIPADPVIVRQNWLAAYDFVTDKGAVALNDYARANDPFTKVGKVQVAVDISSVIRASNDSFTDDLADAVEAGAGARPILDIDGPFERQPRSVEEPDEQRDHQPADQLHHVDVQASTGKAAEGREQHQVAADEQQQDSHPHPGKEFPESDPHQPQALGRLERVKRRT